MANNPLLNSLQQSLGAQPATMPSIQGGQTAALQKLAQATSGKAGAAMSQPRVDDTQERMALQQGRSASQILENERLMQAREAEQAAKGQEQEFNIQAEQLDEKQVNAKQKMQQDAQSIINSFFAEGKKLDFNRDKAKLEQAGFNLRLSNEKYVDKLKAEGQRMRLDSDIAFDEALQHSIWADELDLLNKDLSFKTALNSDKRRWDEELADMDLLQAINISTIDSASRANSQYWSGVSTAVSGASQIGGAAAKSYSSTDTGVQTTGASPAAAASPAAPAAASEPSAYQSGSQVSGPRYI